MATIGKASGAIQGAIKGTTGVGIAQDNIIFGLVLLAFVLWIIQKGELQTYLSFFKGQGGGFQPVPVTGSAATDALNSTNNAVTNAGATLGNLTGASNIGKYLSGAFPNVTSFLQKPLSSFLPGL
jgi:hypothetical protein